MPTMSSAAAVRRPRAKAAAAGARTPKPGSLKLGSFLPYRLSVLASVVSEGLARIYGERFGINIPEWRLVATIGEFRSMTAKAVGAHAHMGKVKVSRAVASLEARGLLARCPNPDDMREAFLVLTPDGEAVYRRIAPLALDYVESLTATLSAAERESLERLVDKLTQRAAAMGR